SAHAHDRRHRQPCEKSRGAESEARAIRLQRNRQNPPPRARAPRCALARRSPPHRAARTGMARRLCRAWLNQRKALSRFAAAARAPHRETFLPLSWLPHRRGSHPPVSPSRRVLRMLPRAQSRALPRKISTPENRQRKRSGQRFARGGDVGEKLRFLQRVEFCPRAHVVHDVAPFFERIAADRLETVAGGALRS